MAASAVSPRENLEHVTVGIFQVQAAAAVPGVDLLAPGLAGVCPVRQGPFPDAAEGGVEVFLVDQERVVLGSDLPARLAEVQRDMGGGLRRGTGRNEGPERGP